ncbi:hypothetical protein WMY93_019368 [Mugilogobius chulae]|uniref:C-type lectin domain-containing protein n=1 Tax=Mugilogobius chulae TaxID=88201 RepID=A0AAW0NE09_9GOBI
MMEGGLSEAKVTPLDRDREKERRGNDGKSTLEVRKGPKMELRGACFLLGLFLLVNLSLQQNPTKRKPVKKEATKDAAIEDLQKQINDIVQELNLLKEQQALQTVCLKGIKVHNKCFLVDSVRKRYHTASEDCNSMGGVLAAPLSSSENDQLRDYIRQTLGQDEQAWLGINDMIAEGDWMDQTGAKITYKNWDVSNYRSPEPNGGMSQNCAVLSAASSGKWSDENCREEKVSVCQFNIV